MEVFEEHVIKMNWTSKAWSNLVHMRRNIGCFLNYTGSNLGDMHVDHQAIVCINLNQFFFGEISSVDVILDIAMLMWKNHVWMSEFVSWSIEINNSKILVNLVFINTKVIITFGSDFSICV